MKTVSTLTVPFVIYKYILNAYNTFLIYFFTSMDSSPLRGQFITTEVRSTEVNNPNIIGCSLKSFKVRKSTVQIPKFDINIFL